MRKYNGSAILKFDSTQTGNAAASKTVTVRITETNALANLFIDDGTTPLSNPFNTDSNGKYGFYASDNTYNIIISEGESDQNIIVAEQIVDSLGLVTGVSSVFTRTGDVVAEASDYDANQIDYSNGASGLSANEVQAAIDEINQKIIDIDATEVDYDTDATVPPYPSAFPNPISVQDVIASIIDDVRVLVGATTFQGVWNADTNAPDLVNATPNHGDFWIVNVAGTTDLDGNNSWAIGDWAVYVNGVWYKIAYSDNPVAASLVLYDPTIWDMYFSDSVTNVQDALDYIVPLIAESGGISAADFDALREKRIRDNAGSGFAEWGKQYDGGTPNDEPYAVVNQGLWSESVVPNVLYAGKTQTGAAPVGTSRTLTPLININGAHINLNYTNSSIGQNKLSFPPAPDGTKTYDTSTGVVVQHPDSATAFAAETATNKVIISRQDYAFIESWHEVIADKDIVYPLGNVQYGASTYEGIPLVNNAVAQGYSAFGEFDTTTTGYGAVFSALTTEQKNIFIGDPANNIYNDGGTLVQVRYRVRVIEAVSDDWSSLGIHPLNQGLLFVAEQADSIVPTDFSLTDVWSEDDADKGYLQGVNSKTIPLCLVQRKNQGGYHVSYNPYGCSKFVGDTFWYDTAASINSTADCFNPANLLAASGDIASGNSGRPDEQFYDAIYASDVQDLRMSSNSVPLTEFLEYYKYAAINGLIRGFEGVPFTNSLQHIYQVSYQGGRTLVYFGVGELQKLPTYAGGASPFRPTFLSTINGRYKIDNMGANVNGDYVYLNSQYGDVSSEFTLNDYYCVDYEQLHKSANQSWTDIIGDPANIAATFPNGVEGQWIPVLPQNGWTTNPLNRKVLDGTLPLEYTINNGGGWNTILDFAVDNNANTIDIFFNSDVVILAHYETQAYFTEPTPLSTMLIQSTDVYSTISSEIDEGCLLIATLTGLVGTKEDVVNTWYFENSGINTKRVTPENSLLPIADSTGLFPLYHFEANTGLYLTEDRGVKTFAYVSQTDGVGELHLAFNQLTSSPTALQRTSLYPADNEVIDIISAGDFLIGTHKFKTQYFINSSNTDFATVTPVTLPALP